RRGVPLFRPALPRFAPIRTEQRVGILYELGKRFVRLRTAAVEILRNRSVPIDVIELGSERRSIGQRTISDDDARRLDQARLDRIVEAEIRDDPVEQSLLR